MVYRTKIQALNDICRQLGGQGGHARTVRALNEWAVLLGGSGGHTRNLAALNEIAQRLGGSGGHGRELDALNAIAGRLGGTGGHGRNLAALAEVVARAGEAEPVDPGTPALVPVFVVGDSNADPVYSPGSWVARTLARLDGRFFAPPGANLAAAGKSTDFALRQLPFLQALTAAWGPGVVWYLHGFNPSANAASEARSFIDAAKAMGHKVLWLMPGAWTAAGASQFPAVIGAYAGDPAVRVVRTDLLLSNTGANLEGTGKGDTEDGTHFNERGNLVVRDAVLAAMGEVWGSAALGYRDAYEMTAVSMAGSGGAVVAPAVGQVPAGWQGWHPYSGDGTVEFACVSEGGRSAVEIRITGNTTATTAWLQLPTATGLPFGYAAGDFIDGTFAGRQVSGRVTRFEITGFPSRLEAAYDLSENLGTGVWRSPGYNLPKAGGGSKLGIVVAVVAPAGASAVVRVWDVAVWKRAVPAFAPVADRGAVPTIGNPAVGAECAVAVGTWFGKPNAVTLAYQWRLDGADIAGATGAGYTPAAAQEGRLLACRVTASNAAGSTSWTTDARVVRPAAATAPVLQRHAGDHRRRGGRGGARGGGLCGQRDAGADAWLRLDAGRGSGGERARLHAGGGGCGQGAQGGGERDEQRGDGDGDDGAGRGAGAGGKLAAGGDGGVPGAGGDARRAGDERGAGGGARRVLRRGEGLELVGQGEAALCRRAALRAGGEHRPPGPGDGAGACRDGGALQLERGAGMDGEGQRAAGPRGEPGGGDGAEQRGAVPVVQRPDARDERDRVRPQQRRGREQRALPAAGELGRGDLGAAALEREPGDDGVDGAGVQVRLADRGERDRLLRAGRRADLHGQQGVEHAGRDRALHVEPERGEQPPVGGGDGPRRGAGRGRGAGAQERAGGPGRGVLAGVTRQRRRVARRARAAAIRASARAGVSASQ